MTWVDLKMKGELPSGIKMRQYPLEVDDVDMLRDNGVAS